jgi:GNAT superfamily N-acetyltransferase
MTSIHPLILRDARPDELDMVRELTLAAYAEYAVIMRPSAWEGLQQAIGTGLNTLDAAECIVAEQHGALIGSVLLFPGDLNTYGGTLDRAGWPEIRLLAVVPAARGCGVGTALLGECVRRAEQAGATALGLHTSESMRIGIRLYERMGFVRAPEYDFQPGGAELVMAYMLPLAREMRG